MVRKSAPEQVETVVVGSGFGGSVTAFRLAQAGREVLVLERGRAYPPGSFPRTPSDVARAHWNPAAGRHGLYDIWSLGGLDALVSAGLGGGSLIFANTLERADERRFARAEGPARRAAPGGRAGAAAASRPRGSGGAARGGTRRGPAASRPWPISRADLEPHYDAVEKMLGAVPFPTGRPGYEPAERTAALRAAAEGAGLGWRQPALAVSFAARGVTAPGLALPEAPYGNVHGRARATCQLAGDCVLGCNHGAKNSLDHTYLSAAAYHGAEIRTRCEVLAIAPDDDGGWVISYAEHHGAVDGTPRDLAMLPARTVRCSRVVLAAGALGSTYLLLRSRSALPGLSPMLGHGFNGNGDALGLVAGARRADGSAWPLGAAPTVTAAVGVTDGAAGHTGLQLYDAGVPALVSWLLTGRRIAGGGLWGGLGHPLRLARGWAADRLRGGGQDDLRGQLARLAEAGADGDAMLALVALGRSAADGVLRLDGDRLGLERASAGRDADDELAADQVRAAMTRLADSLGGRLVVDPAATARRRSTAHPLGGAPMGDSPRDGVVDGHGQVFGHPGLYVLDGAALAGPLGVGPALTIAAFADRAIQHVLSESPGRGGRVPRPRPATPGRVSTPPAAARATSTRATTTRTTSVRDAGRGASVPSTRTAAASAAANTPTTATARPATVRSAPTRAAAKPARTTTARTTGATAAKAPAPKTAARSTTTAARATGAKATAAKATAAKATAAKATAAKATGPAAGRTATIESAGTKAAGTGAARAGGTAKVPAATSPARRPEATRAARVPAAVATPAAAKASAAVRAPAAGKAPDAAQTPAAVKALAATKPPAAGKASGALGTPTAARAAGDAATAPAAAKAAETVRPPGATKKAAADRVPGGARASGAARTAVAARTRGAAKPTVANRSADATKTPSATSVAGVGKPDGTPAPGTAQPGGNVSPSGAGTSDSAAASDAAGATRRAGDAAAVEVPQPRGSRADSVGSAN